MTYNPDEEHKRLSATYDKNEDARERFLPVAHTAILAASIAFVGQVAKPGTGVHMWLAIGTWICSGLALCLASLSFFATRRYICLLIEHVHDDPIEQEKLPAIYFSRMLHEALSMTPALLLLPSVIMVVIFSIVNIWR